MLTSQKGHQRLDDIIGGRRFKRVGNRCLKTNSINSDSTRLFLTGRTDEPHSGLNGSKAALSAYSCFARASTTTADLTSTRLRRPSAKNKTTHVVHFGRIFAGRRPVVGTVVHRLGASPEREVRVLHGGSWSRLICSAVLSTWPTRRPRSS